MPTDYTKLKHPLKGRGTSHSALKAFETCRLRTYYSKVLRRYPDFGSAAERGIKIHGKGEGYLKGTIPSPPKEFKNFRDEMKFIKDLEAIPEMELAVDKNWQRCDYDQYNRTGKVLFRAKLDASLIYEDALCIVDYKTGGIYDDHEKQAEAYAAIGIAHYPRVDNVLVEFWYVDKSERERMGESPFEYEAKDARKLAKDLQKRSLVMDGATMPQLKRATISESNCARCKFRSDETMQDGEAGPCEKWKKIF